MDQFEVRCRELSKGESLFRQLRDCGITTFEEVFSTFRNYDRELTDEEFFICACDVYLTDYPSQKQVLLLKLLAVESKEYMAQLVAQESLERKPLLRCTKGAADDDGPSAHASQRISRQRDSRPRPNLRDRRPVSPKRRPSYKNANPEISLMPRDSGGARASNDNEAPRTSHRDSTSDEIRQMMEDLNRWRTEDRTAYGSYMHYRKEYSTSFTMVWSPRENTPRVN